jgi:amino acid adenylation domain-containing protein
MDPLEDKAECPTWRVSGSQGASIERPANGDIARAIEAAAKTFHDLPALISGKLSLSYKQLNQKTNQIARFLRKRGASGESIVALLLEDPVDRILATIGILKTGAAFLPIDTKLPFERISYMLDNSQAQLIATSSQLSNRLPSGCAPIVCLDSDTQLINVESVEDVSAEWIDLQFVAYVIYTSGSTGTPKGVAICHEGLMNLMSTLIDRLKVGPGARAFHFASPSFDTSVWEILLPLCSGAALCLAGAEDIFPKVLRDLRISHAIFVPSVLAVLDPEVLPDLHTVTTAGEPCSAELVSAWTRPGKVFWNAYGPTECTICASLAFLKPCNPVHIGNPVDGVQLYVLDERLAPVPQGIPGQLFIGGGGVARGYWRASSMTASRFLPDPFSKAPGARMYSTGDRVVRRRGLLEFVGRCDRQVKLRGYRIEPGEIEAALLRHPDVKQAAVTVRDADGSSRLTAYVACSDNLNFLEQPRNPSATSPAVAGTAKSALITRTTLREYLKKSLPLYMIPADFVVLSSFPVTSNGKIDYGALPPPTVPAELTRAETRIEKILFDIWKQVLPTKQFGTHDNFFDAGGNSILAAEVHIHLCRALSREIPLVDILKYPTIHSLAEQLSAPHEETTRESDEIEKRDRPRALVTARRRRAV